MRAAIPVVRLTRDGPLVATGTLVVAARNGRRALVTAVLCRCGSSADKPFCDGAHVKAGFVDDACLPPPAGVAAPQVDAGAAPASADILTITPLPDGPLRCDGSFVVRDLAGSVEAARSPKLCRCGASQLRPYCDGTHRRIGFRG